MRALPASFVLDAGLSPRLAVVGPLDWNAPEIVAALAALDRPAALPAAAEAAKEGTP